ncbi:MAG: prephenate dehydratase, partial [Desulfatiglandales bacterium]
AKRLYSHPYALAQARPWIRKHLSSVELVGVLSTSHAALLALEDREALAISTKESGELYGLKVIIEEIPLRERSWTRFVILGRQVPKCTGKDKTSVYFTLPHRPGTLKRALESFSDSINLCLIFSRPLKGRQWEYGFFLDMEGHISDPGVRVALDSLQSQSVTYKFLGSYGRAWPCL